MARRLVGTLGRRPALAAALIYAAVIVLFLGPGLLPGKTLSSSDALFHRAPWVAGKPAALTGAPSNPDLADWPEQMQVFLRYTARTMPDIPLWNPHIVGGRPYAGNAQSALFGPYTWPVYLLGFDTAMGWIAVLKLWVAAFGTFLFARALGLRFAGALLAGLVFALSLKLVTWLIYPSMGVWTWYPWLVWATERLIRRPGLLTGAGLAVVVAAQFLTGHPESNFHGMLLASSFLVGRVWQLHRARPPGARSPVRPLLAFAGGAAGGAGIAGVTLIPFLELVLRSADFADRRGFSVDNALPFKDAIGLFLPDFWGRPTQTPIRPIMLEHALYVGAGPLLLAAAALILRPTATRIAVAAFGAFWACVVLGVPPFVQVVTRLPVFNSGHNSRLIVFSILAVALLAGWGLDDLARARRVAAARRRLVLVAGAGLLVVPVLIIAAASPGAFGALGGGAKIAWLLADPPGRFRDVQGVEVIRASSLVLWLTMAGATLLLLALRLRGRLGAAPFVALLLLVVAADLFRTGMGQNPAIDRAYAEVPATGAIRFLQGQRPARFVSTREIPQNVLPFDFGLYEARGYDIPIIRRYDRLWRQEIMPGSSVAAAFIDIPLELRELTPRALRTLRLLGVRHILGPKTLEPLTPPFDRLVPVPPLQAPGLRLVYDGPDARVYELDGALPRTWMVGRQESVAGEDAALRAITRPDFDPRRSAVTERPLPGIPAGGGATTGPPGTARLVAYEPERVQLRAEADRAGLVVLGDTHYPGWKATVDGRAAPIERVDYLFRGVRVGPGAHTVELRYEPLSWRIGWICSVVSLIGLALVVAVGLRRRRGGERPGAVRLTSREPVGDEEPVRA